MKFDFNKALLESYRSDCIYKLFLSNPSKFKENLTDIFFICAQLQKAVRIEYASINCIYNYISGKRKPIQMMETNLISSTNLIGRSKEQIYSQIDRLKTIIKENMIDNTKDDIKYELYVNFPNTEKYWRIQNIVQARDKKQYNYIHLTFEHNDYQPKVKYTEMLSYPARFTIALEDVILHADEIKIFLQDILNRED